jgi:hypothetical protein
MSALGHKRTYAVQKAMSALPPKATAKADIAPAAPQEELTWPRALRRYWSRHQRSGRAGRHESGPDDTTSL